MRTALAERANNAADRVVGLVMQHPGSLVGVRGGTGSGRSLVLESTIDRLAADDWRPVMVAPPARHHDTASLALIDIAVALRGDTVPPAFHREWRTPSTWSDRLAQVREWLSEASSSGKLVLVLDDLKRWAIPESAEASVHLADVANLLLRDVSASKVVLAGEDFASDAVDLQPLSLADALLVPGDWGPLAEVAEAIAAEVPDVAGRSPSEIASLVALGALTSVAAVRSWWDPRRGAESVTDALVIEVRRDPALRRLWAAWLELSVPRRAIPAERVAATVDRVKDPLQRAIVVHCLLAIDGSRLGREVRAAAWRAPVDDFVARVRTGSASQHHSDLRYTYEQLASADDATQLVVAAEAIHVAGIIGADDTLGLMPVPFSDELNGAGMSALERFDWGMAARAFDLALEVDYSDALASHYLGYSLDHEAREPKRVELAYERALGLENSFASWHARLICFFVVQARMFDVERRWTQSRSELLAEEGDGPPELYARLHMPVAAHLLRRAEVSMSYKVLDDIPRWVQPQLQGYAAQRHRLEVLTSAQEVGSFVPFYRATERWWLSGPELLSDRHPDGRSLQMWLAGGVEHLDDDGVALSVAIVRRGSAPRTGTTVVTWDQLRDFAADERRAQEIDVGDFVEIGYYGAGSELPSDPMIRILPRSDWTEGIETALDPLRYVRRVLQ